MNTSGEILFEKFEIIDCLKKDENYGVYLANHIFLSKKIFLKILNTDSAVDKEKSERFKREAKILARLDHPNIIKVLDFGTYKSYFYISFEYFESKNLRVFINENKFTISDKEKITAQLLKGLGYAHQNKVIHRDIKPENILVDNDLHLKISDFGLAFSTNDTLVTSQFSILGTPSYMSPEQIRGEPVTEKSDLFSTGIVLYELFSGENPFLGRDAADSINRIINFKEDEIIFHEAEIPSRQGTLIKKLLRKKAAERIENAEEALKMLGIESEPVQIKKSKNSYKRIAVFGIIIIAAIILVSSFVYLMNTKKNDETFNQKTQEQLKQNKLMQDTSSEVSAHVQKKESPEDINNDQKKKTDKAAINKAETIPDLKNEDSVTVGNKNDVAVLQVEKKELPDKNTAGIIPVKFGKLFIDCFPFAKIYIDSEYVETTPIRSNLIVPAGYHKIQLESSKYPLYVKKILIRPDSVLHIKVNLDTVFGFLNCNVFPWAYIYINNKNYGQTPLKKPVILQPGKYILTLKNQEFADKIFSIKIIRSDTVKINYNFRK